MRIPGLLFILFGAVCAPFLAQAHDEAAAQSEAKSVSAIDRRLSLTRSTDDNPFAIAAHKSNYLLPLTLTSNSIVEHGQAAEMKFQFSLFVPMLRNIMGSDAYFAFGYTNQSYWQAYNSKLSSPFTETNHEPELFLGLPYNLRLAGFNQRGAILGLSHQSNGRSPPYSRSWNRLYVDFLFERGNTYFSFKTWYRIPEEKKDFVLQPEGDDNPDIADYMGHFELTTFHKRGGQSYSVMLRHNLSSPNRGAVQIDYDFPITEKLKLTAHLFTGYGESLINYNRHVNRIGIGFRLSNWL